MSPVGLENTQILTDYALNSLSVSLFLFILLTGRGAGTASRELLGRLNEGRETPQAAFWNLGVLPFTSLHFHWGDGLEHLIGSPVPPSCLLPPPATVSYSLVPGNVISSMAATRGSESVSVWESLVLEHTPHLTQGVIVIWLQLQVLSSINICREFRLSCQYGSTYMCWVQSPLVVDLDCHANMIPLTCVESNHHLSWI